MDYRLGTCSACGAQFKVAATFKGDKAKCKQCTAGVVAIGPVQSDAAKDDALEEYVPSKKKSSGPSTMERLRAERAAAASPPKVPARKQAPANPEAKPKASRRAKAVADDGPPDEPEGRKRSGSRTSRATAAAGGRRGGSSRRGKRGDDDDGDGTDGEAHGSRRHRPAPKKKSPAPIIGGFVAILVAGYGLWEFVLKDQGDPQAADKQDEVAANNPTEDVDEPIDAESNGTEEAAPEVDEPDPEPKPAPEPKKEKTDADYDPASVDLTLLTPFEKTADTTDEEWTEIKQLVVTYIDPDAGAAGGRAGRSLEAYGQKAFPAAVNAMLRLDVTQEQDRQNGDLLQKLLQFVANGRNVGWRYTDSNEDAVFNKKAIKKLWDVWERAKDDEAYWKFYAKIETKDGPAEDGVGAASEDDLDDLDDLDGM